MIDPEIEEYVKSRIEQHKHKNIDSPKLDYNDLINTPGSGAAVVARMYRHAALDIANGTLTQIPLDTADFASGITTNTGAGCFQTDTAGYYHIHAEILYGSPIDNQVMQGKIVINTNTGAPFATTQRIAEGTGIQGVQVDDILSLAAGDRIDIYTYQTNTPAGNEDIQVDYTFAYVHKL